MTILGDWTEFYKAITKPLPIASSLFLLSATSFLLFGSPSNLDRLGLSHAVKYRWLVGLLFIIAATWIVVTAIIGIVKRCHLAWSTYRAKRKQQRRLHRLTADERRILSRYVVNEVRTQIFHDAPDLGAAQALADDGVLYRPAVMQGEPVAVPYNIYEWALEYLSKNRGLVNAVVPAETRWSGTGRSRISSPSDRFARSTASLAIVLTVIGLYFTHRAYSWQTKTYQEGVEERILVRLGFEREFDKKEGEVAVEVVNIGMHPIYIKYVEIQPPNGCKTMGVKTDSGVSPDACGLQIYDRLHPVKSNDHIKPLAPGDSSNYTMKWDFSKFPLQDWLMSEGPFEEHLWVEVETTKKGFRQHPIFSWATLTETIPQERRSSASSKRDSNH